MESTTVEPDGFADADLNISDALRDAVEEEMEFLRKQGRDLRLVRARSSDERGTFQVTIQAGDEMYRMSEVSSGHVSRTVFRNPEPDDAMPYQEEEGEEETAEEEGEEETAEEEGEATKDEETEEEEGEEETENETGEEDEKDDGEDTEEGEVEEEVETEEEDKETEDGSGEETDDSEGGEGKTDTDEDT